MKNKKKTDLKSVHEQKKWYIYMSDLIIEVHGRAQIKIQSWSRTPPPTYQIRNWQSSVNKIFPGLMSRWMTLDACMYFNAFNICLIKCLMWSSVDGDVGKSSGKKKIYIISQ